MRSDKKLGEKIATKRKS